jgi:peroxiredoxin Q/BCP
MGLLAWLGLGTEGKAPVVGDPAPNLSATDEKGATVRLGEIYRQGLTLIYFFPKADTPGCTAQACSLRDEFEQLTRLGVRVFGVSSDSAESLRRFKEKRRLPFSFLTDGKHELARAFGVPTILGMTHRQAFLVEKGKIVWRDLHAATSRQAADVIAAVNASTG